MAADEAQRACFRARVADITSWDAAHPREPYPPPPCTPCQPAVGDVLTEALARNGTTLRDFRTVDGATGSNQDRLDCYGRSGLPCGRCGSALTSRVLDQRTSTYCPTCQAH